ncbi:MAG: pilus assembly protein PilP [Desulfobacterales bacterium]
MTYSNLTFKSLLVFLCLAIFFLWTACEKKNEQPPKPVVVSQKIQSAPNNSGESSKPGKTALVENGVVERAESEDEISKLDVSSELLTDLDSAGPEEEMETLFKAEPLLKTDFYTPENKIDPFRPLFREESHEEEIEVSQKVEKEKRIPRTPLERIDLNQLKLVGIIQAPRGNKGLVEEASGKGYIVSLGTYMGTNGGRVVDIMNDRVLVEEETEDILGKLTLQKRELKLQKPFGEN